MTIEVRTLEIVVKIADVQFVIPEYSERIDYNTYVRNWQISHAVPF